MPELGKYVVPIVPDEARTFGMESLFRQFGIYASQGQLYKPVDADMLLYYKEAKDGQILEEGITEAGSMASFTAAGTAYANYGVPMIPFFIYYSMFGFQRVGDLIWAFADSRGKGFLWAAPPAAPRSPAKVCSTRTATATCLPAPSRPAPATIRPSPTRSPSSCRTASAACIEDSEDLFYYLTVYNENYAQPPMPEGVRQEGILKGIYQFRSRRDNGQPAAQLFGSGPILNEALRRSRSCREVRRRRRRLERHQLQRTAPRRAATSSAGTGCTRPSRRAMPYISRRSKAPKARSSPPPTT